MAIAQEPLFAGPVEAIGLRFWDPFKSPDWDSQVYEAPALAIIHKDLKVMYDEPLRGICVQPDGDDITRLHILISGPFETPYEGGFFHFFLRFPPNYPYQPPRVKLMTTGGGMVRFNPNLYPNGKVCLSTLGTWAGPGWTPAHTLLGLVLSMQSLLGEVPYHNEPGHEKERQPGDALAYSNMIQYHTLRTAVCEFVERPRCPKELVDVAEQLFIDNYGRYQRIIETQMELHGTAIYDPLYHIHGDRLGTYDYEAVQLRLESVYHLLKSRPPHNGESCVPPKVEDMMG